MKGRKLSPEVTEGRKRMATAPIRIPKIPSMDSPVGRWIGKLRLALQVRRWDHPKVSEDSLAIFAGYLALLRPPVEGESKVTEVYHQLLTFLFSWRRVQRVPSNLRLLPADPTSLARIAAAVKASWKIENAENASYPEANFVAIALKLPDPEAYVD